MPTNKKKLAFDNKEYLKIQRQEILKRIKSFGGKLYLEFGGKLLHTARVEGDVDLDGHIDVEFLVASQPNFAKRASSLHLLKEISVVKQGVGL